MVSLFNSHQRGFLFDSSIVIKWALYLMVTIWFSYLIVMKWVFYMGIFIQWSPNGVSKWGFYLIDTRWFSHVDFFNMGCLSDRHQMVFITNNHQMGFSI